jgi:acyl-CoA synthetase (AMP-forming)/AMP-acid ligase II
MYISGGENVYPRGGGEVLYHHPAVSEVAVVGVPDQRWGEVGAAWVVLAVGATAGPRMTSGAGRGPASRRPRWPYEIRIVAELPRNATVKVMKAELRRCTAGLVVPRACQARDHPRPPYRSCRSSARPARPPGTTEIRLA